MAPAAHASTILPAVPCASNNNGISNWVHLYYPNDDHPAMCIAGQGSEPVKGTIYSVCGGNNSGVLRGNWADEAPGDSVTVAFNPKSVTIWNGDFKEAQYLTPRAAIGLVDISVIDIYGAHGDATCK